MYKTFAALIATAVALFLTAPATESGEIKDDQPVLKKSEKGLQYLVGRVAGEFTVGYERGKGGMPPCYTEYYADIKYDGESCGTDSYQLGQSIGYNIHNIQRGFKEAALNDPNASRDQSIGVAPPPADPETSTEEYKGHALPPHYDRGVKPQPSTDIKPFMV